MIPGYFQSNYFTLDYWNIDYWLEYGEEPIAYPIHVYIQGDRTFIYIQESRI